MATTGTSFDEFSDIVLDDDNVNWYGHIDLFGTNLKTHTERDKSKVRDVFKWISNEDWEKMQDVSESPNISLSYDEVKKFVRQGKNIYDLLVQSNETIKVFNSSTEDPLPMATSLLAMYNLPAPDLITEDGRVYVANYFVDMLGLLEEDREKIVPIKLFKLGDAVEPEKFVDNVGTLLKAAREGNVEAVAERINVSVDKKIDIMKYVENATVVVLDSNSGEDPADEGPSTPGTPLLTFDTDFGLNMSDTFDEEEIVFNDVGLKSLALAVMVVFPGLLNSLLLKGEYHSNYLTNGKKVSDSVRASDLTQMANKIRKGDLKDGNELANALSGLFIASCYKLMASQQNFLFSDKGFAESRLFLIDMVLTYLGVGVTIDGHVVGDETNVFNDIIKLENNKVIIIRPPFPRARKGLLNRYYQFHKIQTGRFYNYYNIEGEWLLGHQFYETAFWNDIKYKNVLIGNTGQKNLKIFYK